MEDWLHFQAARYSNRYHRWVYGVRRSGTKRFLLISMNFKYLEMYADYFAAKHQLKLFVHDITGAVVNIKEGKKMVAPSKDFKTYYNDAKANQLKSELPNLNLSTNIKDIHVRGYFKTKEEPDWLSVRVYLHDGKKITFKEAVYQFPTPELLAKVGLLM